MRPIWVKSFRRDKGKHQHGVYARLIEVKGDQALIQPTNHGHPVWVPVTEIRVVKSA